MGRRKRKSVYVNIRLCSDGRLCVESEGPSAKVADLLLNALAGHLYRTTPFYVSTDQIVETAADVLEHILHDIEAEDEK